MNENLDEGLGKRDNPGTCPIQSSFLLFTLRDCCSMIPTMPFRYWKRSLGCVRTFVLYEFSVSIAIVSLNVPGYFT